MIITLLIIIGIQILIIGRLVFLFNDMKNKRNEAWKWYMKIAEEKFKK